MFARVASFRHGSLSAVFLPCLIVAFLVSSVIPRANARSTDYLFELDRVEGAAINQAYKINRSGEIVGHGHQAYLFSSGRKHYVTPDSYWSEAVSLNDDGTVVGAATLRREPGSWPGKAFFCKKNKDPVFLDPGDGATWSYARDINNAGDIVLYTEVSKSVKGYVYHANGTYDTIDSLGGNATYPLAINNAATPAIVGASRLTDGKLQAFVWTKSGGTRALATPTGKHSFAIDINDNGTVLGWIGDDAPSVPWYWLQNNTRDPKGAANNNGDAFFSPTFTAVNTSTPNGFVVVWDSAGNLSPPLTKTSDLIFPTAIDNRDRIVGNKTVSGGALRAMLYDKPQLNGWQEFSTIWGFFSNSTVPLNATGISESGDIVVWVGSTSPWTNSTGPQSAVIVPANTRTLPTVDLVPVINGNFVPAYFPAKLKPGDSVDVTARVALGQMGDFPAKTDKFDILFFVPGGMTPSPLPANCTDEQVRIRCTPLNTTRGLEATLTITAPGTGVYEIEFELDTNLMIYEFARTHAHVQIAASPLDVPPLKYRRVDADANLATDPNVAPAGLFYSPLFSHAYSIASDGRTVGRIRNHGWIRTDANTPSTLIGNACTATIPPTNPCMSWLELSAINNHGDAVGMSGTEAKGYAYRRLADGSSAQLSTKISRARAINNSGVITGTEQDFGDYANAFVYDNGALQSLGTLGGHNSYGMVVTPSGSVFGSAEDGNDVLRPFSWTSQQGMRELAPTYSGHVVVTAALENGVYAGSYGARPKRSILSQLGGQNPNAGPDAWFYGDFRTTGRAFISDATQYSDLGFGEVWSVNNKGLAVGTTRHRGSKNGDTLLRSYTEFYNAFLWDDNLQQKFELDTIMSSSTLSPTQPGLSPYYEYLSASGINDRGEITGWRRTPDAIKAFLLTPDPTQITNDVGVVLDTPTAPINVGDVFRQNVTISSPQSTTAVHLYLRLTEDFTLQTPPTECAVQHRVHLYCHFSASEANTQRTIPLQFKANNAAKVSLLALAGSDIPDADTTNNRATTVIEIAARPVVVADLSTTIDVPVTRIHSNETFNAVVSVRNAGRDTATLLQLDIDLPAALSLQSEIAGCVTNTTGLHCTAASLNVNDTWNITLPLQATATGTATIAARIGSDAYDDNAQNNRATRSIDIAALADLALTSATPSPQTVLVDQTVTLQYTLTNNGPSPVNATVTVSYPEAVTLTATPRGCTASTASLQCAFGNLAAKQLQTFDIVLKSALPTEYMVKTSATGDVDDANLANNSVQHRVVVGAPPAPPPTLRIVTPSDGTVWPRDLLSPLMLQVQANHWTIAEGSAHYHWFLDNIDQGAIYNSDSINISHLTSGPHTLQVVMAQANHTLTDIKDGVSLRIDENPKYQIRIEPRAAFVLKDDQPTRDATISIELPASNELGKTIVVTWSLDNGQTGALQENTGAIAISGLTAGDYRLEVAVTTLDRGLVLSSDESTFQVTAPPSPKADEAVRRSAWDPFALAMTVVLAFGIRMRRRLR